MAEDAGRAPSSEDSRQERVRGIARQDITVQGRRHHRTTESKSSAGAGTVIAQ